MVSSIARKAPAQRRRAESCVPGTKTPLLHWAGASRATWVTKHRPQLGRACSKQGRNRWRMGVGGTSGGPLGTVLSAAHCDIGKVSGAHGTEGIRSGSGSPSRPSLPPLPHLHLPGYCTLYRARAEFRRLALLKRPPPSAGGQSPVRLAQKLPSCTGRGPHEQRGSPNIGPNSAELEGGTGGEWGSAVPAGALLE